jgi:hypothetical protein
MVFPAYAIQTNWPSIQHDQLVPIALLGHQQGKINHDA